MSGILVPRRAFGEIFGPTFDASSVPNTQIWARVEDAMVARAGAEALSLTDQSVNARHFGGSSVGNRPTFNLTDATFNNRPSFTHTRPGSAGFGQWLDTSAWSVTPAPPFAIAYVGSHTGDFSTYAAMVDSVLTTHVRTFLGTLPTSGYHTMYSGSFADTTLVAGAAFVAIAQFNGDGSSALYINDMATPKVTGNAGTSSGTGYAMRLGTTAGSNVSSWPGRSTFVAMWSGLLSLAARNHIAKDTATSLGPYYGITVT